MSAKLRLATVGTGYFSQFHHEAWARIPEIQLVASASRDPASLELFAKDFGIPETFDNAGDMLDAVAPDLLDIVAPPQAHYSVIQEAMMRGIPTVCQKPFCNSLRQAEQAVELARERDTLLVVHENFRWQPWYREIKRQLEAGLLGTLYQAVFRLRPGDGQGTDAYLDRQPYFQTMERFLVHETAIHLIDVFRYLLGEPQRVFADLRKLNPSIRGEDAGLVILDFATSGYALFDGNRLVDHAAENRRLTMGEMLLEGSDGTMRLDGDGRIFVRRHGSNVETRISYPWKNCGYAGDCVYELQRHVVDHLLHGKPLENEAAAYVANLRVEDAVYASDTKGAWVEIKAQA